MIPDQGAMATGDAPLAPTSNLSDQRRGNLGFWNYDAAREHGGTLALIDLSQSPPREVSYDELDQRSNRVASLLTRLGVSAGDRMAMSVSNRFEFIEIMFGAMRAGIVPVPLNTRARVPTRSTMWCVDAGCRRSNRRAGGKPSSRRRDRQDRLPCSDQLRIRRGDLARLRHGARQEQPGVSRRLSLSGDHLAFLPYTSGSTGRPKGCCS